MPATVTTANISKHTTWCGGLWNRRCGLCSSFRDSGSLSRSTGRLSKLGWLGGCSLLPTTTSLRWRSRSWACQWGCVMQTYTLTYKHFEVIHSYIQYIPIIHTYTMKTCMQAHRDTHIHAFPKLSATDTTTGTNIPTCKAWCLPEASVS
jgi:hypothetical protein